MHDATQKLIIIMDATLTFKTREEAESFAKEWSRHTLKGHTVSHTKSDGKTTVDLYEVTEHGKTFVDQYVALKNIFN